MLCFFIRGRREAAAQLMGLGEDVNECPAGKSMVEVLNPDFSSAINEQICSEKHFDTLRYP